MQQVSAGLGLAAPPILHDGATLLELIGRRTLMGAVDLDLKTHCVTEGEVKAF